MSGIRTWETELTLFADSIGDANTGVALANPSSEQSITLDLLLRRPDGTLVDQRQLYLPPRGHVAQFLNELFEGMPGTDEFEGTVLVRSATPSPAQNGEAAQSTPEFLPFAGLTLRASGPILTSVPLVAPPSPGDDFTRLAFPQAADGQAGDLVIATTVVLFNPTAEPASGEIDFYTSDGTPNEVSVGGQETSNVPFQIAPGGVYRLKTDGAGDLAVGWARVTMDQPLSGVAIFTIRDGQGNVSAAVGVRSTRLFQNFQMLADTSGIFDTAIALANPLEASEEDSSSTRVTLTLKDTSGNLIRTEDVFLDEFQHRALFLTELFGEEVDGIDEFLGVLEVEVLGEENWVAPLSLRSADEKLTSVPIFTAIPGFAPSALFEFAQNLEETSPAVRWTLHQNGDDWALETVRLSISGVSPDYEAFAPGTRIGFGFVTRPGLTAFLVATDVDPPGERVEFDLYEIRPEGYLRSAAGFIESEADDRLLVEMQYLDKQPRTKTGEADLQVFLDPGLFRADGSAEGEVIADFTSVSRETDRDLRVLRRTRQPLAFAEADPVVPEFSRWKYSSKRVSFPCSNLKRLSGSQVPT